MCYLCEGTHLLSSCKDTSIHRKLRMLCTKYLYYQNLRKRELQ